MAQLLSSPDFSRVIVFARTKRGSSKIANDLAAEGVSATVLNGNKSQNARQRALKQFNDGEMRVLVATDIASRGIDVPAVSHVINYELPDVPESYVHRIGRTARAGAAGVAISFCDAGDRGNLRGIERLIRQSLPLMDKPANIASQSTATDGRKPGQPKKAKRRRPRTRRLAA